MSNPWGPPERAAAREDAILDQYGAALDEARRRFPTEAKADRWLSRHFNLAARQAAGRAIERRLAERAQAERSASR